MKRILLLLACIGWIQCAAAEVVFESGEQQVGLLELYTSEGCSSCPPADRWVSRLKHDDRLWREVIPLSFHVDYWDYIGWKDRFADASYSKRQRRYASERSLSTVYTPGFVYNGREWRGWFDRRLELPGGERPGALRVTVDGKDVVVVFASNREHEELHITVALVGAELATKVQAGENRGRRLQHDFVVMGLADKRMRAGDGGFVASLELPGTQLEAPRYGLVAWVSSGRVQAPVQAVGGWLP